MNIENKQTALKDDAEIYAHNTDNMTDKEKFASLDAKGKWEFFKSYYLGKIAVVLIVAALLISLGWNIFKPKPEQILNISVSDLALSEEETEILKNEMIKALNVDTKKQTVEAYTNMFLISDPYNSMQFFVVHLAGGEFDVIILPQQAFEGLAPNSYFMPVTEILDEKEMERFKDKLVYSGVFNEDHTDIVPGSEQPYGIKADGSKYISGNGYTEPIVIAVAVNSKHTENVKAFIDLVFGD